MSLVFSGNSLIPAFMSVRHWRTKQVFFMANSVIARPRARKRVGAVAISLSSFP
jgi:hypothetical protein